MTRHFLCLEGDGIGPEIRRATLTVIDAIAQALGQPLERSHADRNRFRGDGEVMPDPDTALAFRKIARAADLSRGAFAKAMTALEARTGELGGKLGTAAFATDLAHSIREALA